MFNLLKEEVEEIEQQSKSFDSENRAVKIRAESRNFEESK